MFIGQYEHHLEEKGRLSIPKKFRSQLADGAVLCQGLDGCLFLYPQTTWSALVTKIQSLPITQADARGFIRSLSFTATEVDIDSLGRILIPDYLRTSASLKSDCIIAGAVDRVEIWEKTKFIEYSDRITSHAEEIAEKLSPAGI